MYLENLTHNQAHISGHVIQLGTLISKFKKLSKNLTEA